MITNRIPITVRPALLPAGHQEILKERASKVLPHLDVEVQEKALCELYGVDSLNEMIDGNELLDRHEVQPALSSEQLHQMASRITKYGPPEESELYGKSEAAIWAARNILDCIPQSLEDVTDYWSPTSCIEVIIPFLPLMTPEAEQEKEALGVVRPITREILAKTTQERVDFAGSLAMAYMNKQDPMKEEYGFTHRQRMLTRCHQYFVLHKLGYPVSSLWLAEFLGPSVFCNCPEPNCGGRHFGFTDPAAVVNLVLENRSYIEKLSHGELGQSFGDGDKTGDQVAGSTLTVVTSAIESLLMIDPERKQNDEMQKLMDLAYPHRELLEDLEKVRLGFQGMAALFLYGDQIGGEQRKVSNAEVKSTFFAAKRLMNELSAKVQQSPERACLPLFDAQNFCAAGQRLIDSEYGTALQALFLTSLYSSHAVEDMFCTFNDLSELSESGEIDDTDPFVDRLFNGYKTNFLGMLALREASADGMTQVLVKFGNEETIRIVAERGVPEAINALLKYLPPGGVEEEFWTKELQYAALQP